MGTALYLHSLWRVLYCADTSVLGLEGLGDSVKVNAKGLSLSLKPLMISLYSFIAGAIVRLGMWHRERKQTCDRVNVFRTILGLPNPRNVLGVFAAAK